MEEKGAEGKELLVKKKAVVLVDVEIKKNHLQVNEVKVENLLELEEANLIEILIIENLLDLEEKEDKFLLIKKTIN